MGRPKSNTASSSKYIAYTHYSGNGEISQCASPFPENFYMQLRRRVERIYNNEKIEINEGIMLLFENMIQRHIANPYGRCSCEAFAIRLKTLMRIMVGDLDFIKKEKERARRNEERKKRKLRIERMKKSMIQKKLENSK